MVQLFQLKIYHQHVKETSGFIVLMLRAYSPHFFAYYQILQKIRSDISVMLQNSKKLNQYSFIFIYFLFICPFLLTANNFPLGTFYPELLSLVLALILSVLFILNSSDICISNVSIAIFAFILILFAQVLFLNVRIPQIHLSLIFELSIAVLFSLGINSYIARNEEHIRKLVLTIALAIIVGTTIQAIYGYLQFTGIALKLPNLILYSGSFGDTIYGNLGFKGDYDCFLMLGVFSLIYLYSKQKMRQTLFILHQSFYLLIITLTSARTIFLVFLFAVIALGFYIRSHQVDYKRTKSEARKFLWAFVVTLMIYLLLQILVPFIFNYLMHNTHIGNIIAGLNANVLSGSKDYGQINSALHRVTDRADFSADGSYRRLYEWYKAIYLFVKHPLLGVGWYQYPHEAAYLMENARFMYMPAYNEIFSNPHNVILNILAETGIIGFLVIIVFGIGYSFYRIIKNFNNIETLFISLVLLNIFAFSQVEYPLWYAYFLLYFVMFLSIDKPVLVIKNNRAIKLAVGFIGFSLFLILEIGLSTYNKLVFYTSVIPEDQSLFSQNVQDLVDISNNNILWRYPALKVLSLYINPDFPQINGAMPIDKQIYYRKQVTEEFPSPLVILHQIELNKIGGNEESALKYAKLLAYAYPNRRDEVIAILQKKDGFVREIAVMQEFKYKENNIFKPGK